MDIPVLTTQPWLRKWWYAAYLNIYNITEEYQILQSSLPKKDVTNKLIILFSYNKINVYYLGA